MPVAATGHRLREDSLDSERPTAEEARHENDT